MTDADLPTAQVIVGALQQAQRSQTDYRPDGPRAAVMDPILALHRSNRRQWDREDDTRRVDADDITVAAAKREIDRLNAARHGFIEAIDRTILHATDPGEKAPLVTESPGMAIDRLSILVIRLASTETRAASGTIDASVYAKRVPRLRAQLGALEEAIATLFDDLACGTRRFFAYDSLKLYGPGVLGEAD